MSGNYAWVHAFARQADADFKGWELYQQFPEAVSAECHKLLLLQMACEKLCKAYLLKTKIHPIDVVTTTHGLTQRHLPTILRQEISDMMKVKPHQMNALMTKFRHLAGEIEILNPAMKRGDVRPDNCEYPWTYADGDEVFSPLDWQFAPTRLLLERNGPAFLKTLRMAIDRILNESP